jgi:hypothetical protein
MNNLEEENNQLAEENKALKEELTETKNENTMTPSMWVGGLIGLTIGIIYEPKILFDGGILSFIVLFLFFVTPGVLLISKLLVALGIMKK